MRAPILNRNGHAKSGKGVSAFAMLPIVALIFQGSVAVGFSPELPPQYVVGMEFPELERALKAHENVSGEPVRVIVLREDGGKSQPSSDEVARSAAQALERWKLGKTKKNGVILWLKPSSPEAAGVALGFALDGLWSSEARTETIQRRVLPVLRKGRIQEAAALFVWAALERFESPILGGSELRESLKAVGLKDDPATLHLEVSEEEQVARIPAWMFWFLFSAFAVPLFWMASLVAAAEARATSEGWLRVSVLREMDSRLRFTWARWKSRAQKQAEGAIRGADVRW